MRLAARRRTAAAVIRIASDDLIVSSREEAVDYYARWPSVSFLVRIYYLRFMWPILLLAVLISMLGVWKLHEVMVFARNDLPASHVMHHYIWAQECAFWLIVVLSAYGVFLLLTAM